MLRRIRIALGLALVVGSAALPAADAVSARGGRGCGAASCRIEPRARPAPAPADPC